MVIRRRFGLTAVSNTYMFNKTVKRVYKIPAHISHPGVDSKFCFNNSDACRAWGACPGLNTPQRDCKHVIILLLEHDAAVVYLFADQGGGGQVHITQLSAICVLPRLPNCTFRGRPPDRPAFSCSEISSTAARPDTPYLRTCEYSAGQIQKVVWTFN